MAEKNGEVALSNALDAFVEQTDNSSTEPAVSQDPDWIPESVVDANGEPV